MTSRPEHADLPWREIIASLAGLAAAGTMIELALIGHWHGLVQLIPWAVAYSVITGAWATVPPTTTARLRLARTLACISIVACVHGSYTHFDANFGFASELHPSAGFGALIVAAAQGRIPLLAPLFLALPSGLVLLASWGGVARNNPLGAVPASTLRWKGRIRPERPGSSRRS